MRLDHRSANIKPDPCTFAFRGKKDSKSLSSISLALQDHHHARKYYLGFEDSTTRVRLFFSDPSLILTHFLLDLVKPVQSIWGQHLSMEAMSGFSV